MAMVCGALPIIGKSWVGEDDAGSLGVSQINSSSCSLLGRVVGGLKPGGRQPAPEMAPTVTGSHSHSAATLTEACLCVCWRANFSISIIGVVFSLKSLYIGLILVTQSKYTS